MATSKSKQNFVKEPGKLDLMDAHKVNELLKCMNDPIYFTETYVKVQHPKRGSINLLLYPYQKELITAFFEHRYGVFLTARQMGKSIYSQSIISHNSLKVKIKNLIKLTLKEKLVSFLENILVKLSS